MSSHRNQSTGKALWNGNLDLRVDKRYRLLRRIGKGGWGYVYEATDLQTSETVAIKLESIDIDPSILEEEVRAYETLRGKPGIPRVYWHGAECDFNAMVFDLLGPSLEDLFNFCSRKFSLKTVLMLADQLISRFQQVHSKGMIHRDIKPENLVMGTGKHGNVLYVIDFGICKEYRQPTRDLPSAQEWGIPLIGTERYASINAHSGTEQSRRDDMESLGYVMLYFLRGSLPWQGLKATSHEQKAELILEKKKAMSPEELCVGLPDKFAKYFHHVRSLNFGDKPNYQYLRKLFRTLFVAEGFEHDNVFDWTVLKFLMASENPSAPER